MTSILLRKISEVLITQATDIEGNFRRIRHLAANRNERIIGKLNLKKENKNLEFLGFSVWKSLEIPFRKKSKIQKSSCRDDAYPSFYYQECGSPQEQHSILD